MLNLKKSFLLVFTFFTLFTKVNATEQNQLAQPIIFEKKIAIISSGLPGVGKSTLLRALSQKICNSIYLDKDVINRAMLQNEDQLSEYYNKYVKNQGYDVILALARNNLLLSNHIVILDGFFGDKLKSPRVSQFMNTTDFETKIIFFYCSKETNEERLRYRNESRDLEQLKDFSTYYLNTIEKHLQQLENIPHLAINTENDFDINLNEIINYLKN